MALESIGPATQAHPVAQPQNQQQQPLARDNERAGGVATESPNDEVVISLGEDARADNDLNREQSPAASKQSAIRRQLLEAATESRIELKLNFDIQRGVSFIQFTAGDRVLLSMPSERFYDFVEEQLRRNA